MRIIPVICIVVYGSLILPVLGGSEENGMMDEIMEVMKLFGIDSHEHDPAADAGKENPIDSVDLMKSNDVCPVLNDTTSLTAVCTEITYSCKGGKVLVFGEEGGLCLSKDGSSTRKCDSHNGYNSLEPRCSAVCEVQEVPDATWELHQPNGVLIGDKQVLPKSKISYTCNKDFELIGERGPFECLETGTFSGELPSCQGQRVPNITECGGGEWTKIIQFDLSKGDQCPSNWQLVNHQGKKGCDSKVNGACSPVFMNVGNVKFSSVCGRAIGYQIAFPDAFAVGTTPMIDRLYVDGLSITYGFPREHVWTYAVGASKDFLFDGKTANCPCDKGEPQPRFVGEHMYCDSGHRVSTQAEIEQFSGPNLYTEIHNQTLWTDQCGEEKANTCCQDQTTPHDWDDLVNPPWFRRDDLKIKDNSFFEIRLCTHEIDMQEGALITAMDLYVK